MWPWKHNPSNRDLLERLESVERRFKLLLTDCDDFFDSMRKCENRIKAKSAKIEAHQSQAEGTEETMADAVPSTSNGILLSPRAKMIQQQILRRRAGLQ